MKISIILRAYILNHEYHYHEDVSDYVQWGFATWRDNTIVVTHTTRRDGELAFDQRVLPPHLALGELQSLLYHQDWRSECGYPR